ncbi:death-on-curing family protein [Paenibacillus kribbensis]|uniref:Death-on-curing family protein n=1 Tax=Paenibacillus kribbensis TaxID=172713 RepID=A0A222WSB4_9BACL|nr:type II toxin-antitoxin system death-on-curing family toxin [Paenibacillus kribbensis]ASR49540.1 death-on-curing family protein [Paenibacillus kribbensis]
MSSIRFLTIPEVIAIHVAMIERYSKSEQIGFKDIRLLESAVLRPQSSAFSEDTYPTIFSKAAALFESLGQNHPFHHANKRTAFTALLMFLRYNNFQFKMDQKAAEDFTVDMVNHKFSLDQLALLIELHSSKLH